VNEILRNIISGMMAVLLLYTLIVAFFAIAGMIQISCIDSQLSDMYDSEIFPEASQEIHGVVNRVKAAHSEEEKLNNISKYVQKGFISFLNNKSWKNDDIFRVISQNLGFHLFPEGEHYYSDPGGRRIIRDGKYANNPYFIAYYHAGACGEHAILAGFLANMSGLEVRRVSDPSRYHAWLEVKVRDKWYFYDPTIPPSLDSTKKWFAPTEFRSNSSIINNAARVVTDDGEDITHHYPPYGSLNISGIMPFDSLYISWGPNWMFRYEIDVSEPFIRINLTPREYNLHCSRCIFFTYNQNFTIEEGKTVNVNVRSYSGGFRKTPSHQKYRIVPGSILSQGGRLPVSRFTTISLHDRRIDLSRRGPPTDRWPPRGGGG